MQRYYTGNILALPTIDLLQEVEKSLGYRIKLDDVAQATLGVGKSGHGLMAVEYWKNGEIEKLKEYCLQDVRVTRDIYDHALRHQEVAFHDRQGQRQRLPLPISPPEPQQRPVFNLSLGL